MNRKFLAGALVISAFAPLSLVEAKPAEASSWNEATNSITIHDGDSAGTYFDIFYHDSNFIWGKNMSGLSAQARFKLTENFDSLAQKAEVEIIVENTSDSSVWESAELSKITVAATPNETGASLLKNGDFDVISTSLNVGDVGTFYTTLSFQKITDSFSVELDNFYTVWKNLEREDGLETGDYAKGYGQVPTPALIPAIIGAGVAALRKRKKENEDEDEMKLA